MIYPHYHVQCMCQSSIFLFFIFIIKDCNGTMTRLTHLSGDKGRQWHEVMVYVPAQTTPHSFVLQAVKGSGVLSDIAVDDIEYYTGQCKCKYRPSKVRGIST